MTAAVKWVVALAVAGAAWGGVTAALLRLDAARPVATAVVYRDAPCEKPWMSARDERAVCAMEAAARQHARRRAEAR